MNEWEVMSLLLGLGIFLVAWLVFALLKGISYDRPSSKPPVAVSTIDGPIKFPGYMPYQDNHGCYVAKFSNVSDLNKYFMPDRAGWLKSCVAIIPTSNGDLLAIITNKLRDEELAELEEWSYEKHAHFQEKREAKLKLREEEEAKQLQQEKEQLHYSDIGRRYVKDKNAMQLMPAGSKERKEAEAKLNKGELNE